MATVREDVVVSLGVDHSQVEPQLQTAKGRFKSWGKQVETQFGGNTTVMGTLLQTSMQKSLNTLQGIFAINFASMVSNALVLWDDFTKRLANAFVTRQHRGNEKVRLEWRKANEERWANEKALVKAEEDRIEKEKKLYQQLADLEKDRKLQMAGGPASPEGQRMMDEWRQKELDAAIEKIDHAKTHNDLLAAQVEYEKATIDIIKSQNAEKLKAQIVEQRANKEKRDKLQPIFDSGKHDAALAQIAGLESEAAMLQSKGFSDLANRRLRQSGGLRQGIKADLMSETAERKTPQQRIMEEIAQWIAPMKNDGAIPVSVRIKE